MTEIRFPNSSDIAVAEPHGIAIPEHEYGDVASLFSGLHYQTAIADNTPEQFSVGNLPVTLPAPSILFAPPRSMKTESMISRSQAISLVSSTLLAGFFGGASLFAWIGIGAHPLFWLTGAFGAAGVATAEVLLVTKKTKTSVWSDP